MKGVLHKFLKIWKQIENIILVIPMMLIGLLIIYQICIRALGFSGIGWLEEFSRYIFGISTLMACSIAVETNAHMSVDALYNSLPKNVAKILRVFLNTINTGLWSFVAVLSFRWMKKVHQIGTTAASLRTFPMWVIWVLISVCFLTMSIRYLIQLIKSIKTASAMHKDDNQRLTQAELAESITEEAKEW